MYEDQDEEMDVEMDSETLGDEEDSDEDGSSPALSSASTPPYTSEDGLFVPPKKSNNSGKPSSLRRGRGRPKKDFEKPLGIKLKRLKSNVFVKGDSNGNNNGNGSNKQSVTPTSAPGTPQSVSAKSPSVSPVHNDNFAMDVECKELETTLADKIDKLDKTEKCCEKSFPMSAPDDPPLFPETWPGKICALCNLSERSQLGQREMIRLLCPEGHPARKVGQSPGQSPHSSHGDKSPRGAQQIGNRRHKSREGKSSCETLDELSVVGYTEEPEVSYIFEPTGHFFVHLSCILWSEGVKRNDSDLQIENGASVVFQAMTRRCSYCARFGASVVCSFNQSQTTCGLYFHYPCCLAAGGFMDNKTKTLICTLHLDQVPLLPVGESSQCSTCLSLGNVSNLVMCTSCGGHHHGSCVGLALLPGVRAGWQCFECRVCQVCRQPSEIGKIMICESCDKAYHPGCLRPIVTSIPKYGWKCKCCRVCSDCGSRTPGAGLSSRWHNHFSVCDSCYQQRNKGYCCPVCGRAYRAAAHREMVQCCKCKKYVHGSCDNDADMNVFTAKKETNPDHEYTCPLCKNAPATNPCGTGAPRQAVKRKDSFDDSYMDTSLSASQESLYGDDSSGMDLDHSPSDKTAEDHPRSIGLGKGKPSTNFSKKRLGISSNSSSRQKGQQQQQSAGKVNYQKMKKMSDYGKKRGIKTKMRGIFGVPGLGLQRPQADPSKSQDDEPGVENRMVLCSGNDKFVITQDICVMCGALGTDQEGCLIACAQCGQCYHPYCVNVKVTKVILQKGWRCLDCTVCEGCGQRNDDARLILCDDCDVSYHIYCMDPPLEHVPRGNWKCKWCVMCIRCGSNDPGFNCNWMSSYTECGPCASHINCPSCFEPYCEGDLVIQCEQCERWLHGSCDNIRTEADAEKCAEERYSCLLCRPRDVPPPHLQPPPILLRPLVKPPTPTKSPELPKYSQSQFIVDGVCLSEVGMHQIKSLAIEQQVTQRKKRVTKRIPSLVAPSTQEARFLATIESVASGREVEEPHIEDGTDDIKEEVKEEPVEIWKEGMEVQPREDGKPPEPPEGFTIVTNEAGVLVLRKKRTRNLQKLGIGGFLVRFRSNRKVEDDENEPGAEKPQSADPMDKPKRKPIRRKPRSKLVESFPAYLQEAFFGRDLLDLPKEHKELNSSSDSEKEDGITIKVTDDKTIQLSKDELKVMEDVKAKQEKEEKEKEKMKEEELKKLKEKSPIKQEEEEGSDSEVLQGLNLKDLPLPGDLLDTDLVNTIMAEDDIKSGENLEESLEASETSQHKDELTDILSPHFNLESMVRDSGLPNMDSKDVEEIFKGVLTDDSQESQAEFAPLHLNVQQPPLPQQQNMLPSSFPSPSPYHSEYSNSPHSQLSEPPSPWVDESPMSVDAQHPHSASYSAQRSTPLKMEADEALGLSATISSVLYANTNHPEWKKEFPVWSDRCKQILKKWRALSTEQKAPYLQQARDNRSALRMKKTQQDQEKIMQQKSNREAEEERHWKQLQAIRQAQQQQQQQVLQEQRIQAIARMNRQICGDDVTGGGLTSQLQVATNQEPNPLGPIASTSPRSQYPPNSNVKVTRLHPSQSPSPFSLPSSPLMQRTIRTPQPPNMRIQTEFQQTRQYSPSQGSPLPDQFNNQSPNSEFRQQQQQAPDQQDPFVNRGFPPQQQPRPPGFIPGGPRPPPGPPPQQQMYQQVSLQQQQPQQQETLQQPPQQSPEVTRQLRDLLQRQKEAAAAAAVMGPVQQRPWLPDQFVEGQEATFRHPLPPRVRAPVQQVLVRAPIRQVADPRLQGIQEQRMRLIIQQQQQHQMRAQIVQGAFQQQQQQSPSPQQQQQQQRNPLDPYDEMVQQRQGEGVLAQRLGDGVPKPQAQPPPPVGAPPPQPQPVTQQSDHQEIPESVTAELEQLEQETGQISEVEAVSAILGDLADDDDELLAEMGADFNILEYVDEATHGDKTNILDNLELEEEDAKEKRLMKDSGVPGGKVKQTASGKPVEGSRIVVQQGPMIKQEQGVVDNTDTNKVQLPQMSGSDLRGEGLDPSTGQPQQQQQQQQPPPPPQVVPGPPGGPAQMMGVRQVTVGISQAALQRLQPGQHIPVAGVDPQRIQMRGSTRVIVGPGGKIIQGIPQRLGGMPVAPPPPPPPYPGPPPPYPGQQSSTQEQPLLLEDLLEQEKREQEKQHQTADGSVGGGAGMLSDMDVDRLVGPGQPGPPVPHQLQVGMMQQKAMMPGARPPFPQRPPAPYMTAASVGPRAVVQDVPPPPPPTQPRIPQFNAPVLPPPPLPPEMIVTEQDRQTAIAYENWLNHQNQILQQQLKYYETEVQKLRKARKSLNSKQRQLRKNGNELTDADALELQRVSTEQAGLQKHLDSSRKSCRQHGMLIQEYRNKQQKQRQQQQPPQQQTSPGPGQSPLHSSTSHSPMHMGGPGSSPMQTPNYSSSPHPPTPQSPMMSPSPSPLHSPGPQTSAPPMHQIVQSPMSPHSMQPSPRIGTPLSQGEESPFSPGSLPSPGASRLASPQTPTQPNPRLPSPQHRGRLVTSPGLPADQMSRLHGMSIAPRYVRPPETRLRGPVPQPSPAIYQNPGATRIVYTPKPNTQELTREQVIQRNMLIQQQQQQQQLRNQQLMNQLTQQNPNLTLEQKQKLLQLHQQKQQFLMQQRQQLIDQQMIQQQQQLAVQNQQRIQTQQQQQRVMPSNPNHPQSPVLPRSPIVQQQTPKSPLNTQLPPSPLNLPPKSPMIQNQTSPSVLAQMSPVQQHRTSPMEACTMSPMNPPQSKSPISSPLNKRSMSSDSQMYQTEDVLQQHQQGFDMGGGQGGQDDGCGGGGGRGSLMPANFHFVKLGLRGGTPMWSFNKRRGAKRSVEDDSRISPQVIQSDMTTAPTATTAQQYQKQDKPIQGILKAGGGAVPGTSTMQRVLCGEASTSRGVSLLPGSNRMISLVRHGVDGVDLNKPGIVVQLQSSQQLQVQGGQKKVIIQQMPVPSNIQVQPIQLQVSKVTTAVAATAATSTTSTLSSGTTVDPAQPRVVSKVASLVCVDYDSLDEETPPTSPPLDDKQKAMVNEKLEAKTTATGTRREVEEDEEEEEIRLATDAEGLELLSQENLLNLELEESDEGEGRRVIIIDGTEEESSRSEEKFNPGGSPTVVELVEDDLMVYDSDELVVLEECEVLEAHEIDITNCEVMELETMEEGETEDDDNSASSSTDAKKPDKDDASSSRSEEGTSGLQGKDSRPQERQQIIVRHTRKGKHFFAVKKGQEGKDQRHVVYRAEEKESKKDEEKKGDSEVSDDKKEPTDFEQLIEQSKIIIMDENKDIDSMNEDDIRNVIYGKDECDLDDAKSDPVEMTLFKDSSPIRKSPSFDKDDKKLEERASLPFADFPEGLASKFFNEQTTDLDNKVTVKVAKEETKLVDHSDLSSVIKASKRYEKTKFVKNKIQLTEHDYTHVPSKLESFDRMGIEEPQATYSRQQNMSLRTVQRPVVKKPEQISELVNTSPVKLLPEITKIDPKVRDIISISKITPTTVSKSEDVKVTEISEVNKQVYSSVSAPSVPEPIKVVPSLGPVYIPRQPVTTSPTTKTETTQSSVDEAKAKSAERRKSMDNAGRRKSVEDRRKSSEAIARENRRELEQRKLMILEEIKQSQLEKEKQMLESVKQTDQPPPTPVTTAVATSTTQTTGTTDQDLSDVMDILENIDSTPTRLLNQSELQSIDTTQLFENEEIEKPVQSTTTKQKQTEKDDKISIHSLLSDTGKSDIQMSDLARGLTTKQSTVAVPPANTQSKLAALLTGGTDAVRNKNTNKDFVIAGPSNSNMFDMRKEPPVPTLESLLEKEIECAKNEPDELMKPPEIKDEPERSKNESPKRSLVSPTSSPSKTEYLNVGTSNSSGNLILSPTSGILRSSGSNLGVPACKILSPSTGITRDIVSAVPECSQPEESPTVMEQQPPQFRQTQGILLGAGQAIIQQGTVLSTSQNITATQGGLILGDRNVITTTSSGQNVLMTTRILQPLAKQSPTAAPRGPPVTVGVRQQIISANYMAQNRGASPVVVRRLSSPSPPRNTTPPRQVFQQQQQQQGETLQHSPQTPGPPPPSQQQPQQLQHPQQQQLLTNQAIIQQQQIPQQFQRSFAFRNIAGPGQQVQILQSSHGPPGAQGRMLITTTDQFKIISTAPGVESQPRIITTGHLVASNQLQRLSGSQSLSIPSAVMSTSINPSGLAGEKKIMQQQGMVRAANIEQIRIMHGQRIHPGQQLQLQQQQPQQEIPGNLVAIKNEPMEHREDTKVTLVSPVTTSSQSQFTKFSGQLPRTDESQNVLLKQLLQNTACASGGTPTSPTTAPGVPSLEAQLAKPVPPTPSSLIPTLISDQNKVAPSVSSPNTQQHPVKPLPSPRTPGPMGKESVTCRPTNINIEARRISQSNRTSSREDLLSPTNSTRSSFGLRTPSPITSPQAGAMIIKQERQEIKKEPEDIKQEHQEPIDPITEKMLQEQAAIDLKKLKRRQYQQKRRQSQGKEGIGGTPKKRARKCSRMEEDYETYTDNLMTQLRQMPTLNILEPMLVRNYNVCCAFGAGDWAKCGEKVNNNCELKGNYGHAHVNNVGDYYTTKPFGDCEKPPAASPVSTQRGFYDQEFTPVRIYNDSEEKKLEQLLLGSRERDTDTPDTVVSSSSPECVSFEPQLKFPALNIIKEEVDEEVLKRASPVIPIIAPIPIRLKPGQAVKEHFKDTDKENSFRDSVKKNLPSAFKDPSSVTVTLTLNSDAAQDILGVLKDLANILHIPAPTTYQVVERTTTPPSIKLGLYRNKGKDGKEGVPVDIQSILNGQAKFCRHCDVVILNNMIRKKVSELPFLSARDDLLDNTEELYFCSSGCYMQFSLMHKSPNNTQDKAAAIVDHLSHESKKPRLSIDDKENFGKKDKKDLKKDEKAKKPNKGNKYKFWQPGSLQPPTRYKKQSERELMEMLFRVGVTLTPSQNSDDTRKCLFCHQVGDGVADGPARLLNFDVDKWVHLNCALWSDDVYETVNGALMNVDNALQLGQSTPCSLCNQNGATLHCFKLRCSNVYHLGCAVKDECVFFKNKTTYCSSHVPKNEKDNELTTLSVYRRVYVNRDENRQVASVMHQSDQNHLLRVGSLIFLSVGQLLPHQLQSFHTPNYIYPVGYKIIRFYWSMRRPNKRCRYICSIHDCGGRPEFRILVQEPTYNDIELIDSSPKAVWSRILEPLAQLRKDNGNVQIFPRYVCGEDLFGLNEPAVVRVLESLPGVETLNDYKFKYGRNPLLELPLAVNPTGCARSEPRLKNLIPYKRPHTQRTAASTRPNLFAPSLGISTGEAICPYSKQFVHSKSSQYKKMKLEWRNNVYLARSKIQGLGLYAARDLERHTMVIEYIGEIIRHELSESREKQYEARNRGIYMFRLDEERVVDATISGGLARYINHSCNPNCVTEIVEVDRDLRIIIFAKRRISRGEELAYDYKFDIEDDQHKIPCLCGAPNCRKWMN